MRLNPRSILVLMSVGCLLTSCDSKPEVAAQGGRSATERREALASAYGLEASQRLLEPDELAALSPFQLKIMKNGIFARHGYVFTTDEMKEYFEKQPWYEPDETYTESRLTAIEKENLALMKKFEAGSRDAGSSSDRRAIVRTWGAKLAESQESTLERTEYELMDVDGDGDRDAVAIYSLAPRGANMVYATIAVFDNEDGVLTFKASTDAGATGTSFPSKIVRASKGEIICNTDVWLEDDAQCCPSGKGTTVFALRGGELVHER